MHSGCHEKGWGFLLLFFFQLVCHLHWWFGVPCTAQENDPFFFPLDDFFYPSSLSVRALCVSHSPTILTLCKQALIVLCMHGCVQSEVVFYDINVYGCNSRACFILYHLGITAVSDGRGYMNAKSWGSFEYFLKRICLFFFFFPQQLQLFKIMSAFHITLMEKL